MTTTTNKNGDQGTVQELLPHCNPEDQRAIKPVLEQLSALGTGQPIQPSPEIAAILAAPSGGEQQPTPLNGLRRRSRRTAITILAVTVSLGAGSTAAAAATDEAFRTNLGNSISAIISTITGGHINPAGKPSNGHNPEQKPQHPAPVPGPGNHGDGQGKAPAGPGAPSEPAPKETTAGPNNGPATGRAPEPKTSQPTVPGRRL
jgi:hypothetical protein